VVAFNKLFNARLAEVLGDKFDACKSASGTHARVEQNGEALLRSIAKLACDGHDLYSKGDGLLIRDWLKENYPDLIVKSVGRVELSKRQDWTLEVSAKMLALLPAITEYLIETGILDPNVLRDSTGRRIELMHFEFPPPPLSLPCLPSSPPFPPSPPLSLTPGLFFVLLPQAYIHVSAILWGIGFDELRSLTNAKDVNLNPREVNELHEQLFKMGRLL
jgi:hypothetical protein